MTVPTFEQRLAEYRKGLERQELIEEFMDSLDGRGGICARDAAEEYADEAERIEAGTEIIRQRTAEIIARKAA